MKKICLICPPSPFLLDERVFPFLGILKVASAWEQKGAKIDVLDLSGIDNYTEVVEDYLFKNRDLEFVGITATTPQMPNAFRIGELIRSQSNCKLVLGGSHATLIHTASKREIKRGIIGGRSTKEVKRIQHIFDVLVCGDGELVLDAIRKIDKGVIDVDDRQSPYFLSNEDFSTLPNPARHLIDLSSYHYHIEGERATSMISQLGCPFRCVSMDERVPTERGLLKISDLTIAPPNREPCSITSDLTVSSEKKAAKISHVLNQGVQPTKRIELEGMLDLTAHPEHRIRVARDGKLIWSEMKDVKLSDWVLIQAGSYCYPEEYVELRYDGYRQNITNTGNFLCERYTIPKKLDEDLAWIMGFLVGDGSFGKQGITFAVDSNLEQKLREKVKKLFNYDIKVYPIKSTDKVKQAWIYSREILDFFRRALDFEKDNKHRVSELIYRSPKLVIEKFIEGLWDADAYKKADYLVTAYRSLGKEILDLLIYLGHPASMIEVFNKKTQRLSYRVCKIKRNRVPCFRTVYWKNGEPRFRKTPAKDKVHLRKETLEKVDPNHELLGENWFFVKVKTIEDGEPQILYDLTVPGIEAYVSSGFVSHNCTFCSGRNSPYLRKIRNRSVDSVIAELESIYLNYGYKGIMFYDDELNVSKFMVPMMQSIANLSEKHGVDWKLRGFTKAELFTKEQAKAMYNAGFRWILTGFESGDPRILKNIDKIATRDDNTRCVEIAKEAGLKVKALMSMGHAGETPESIENTKNWLLKVEPDDFDCTVITTYPGSPYFDDAILNEESGIYEYTMKKTGDKLYQQELDYTKDADYYKGVPGEYKSFVWTDAMSSEDLAKARDYLEAEVRSKLEIPFNPANPTRKYEHSMGQGNMPDWILRTTEGKKDFKQKRKLKVIQ